MNIVIFYEKPGCTANKKQKRMLRSSGCVVIERNLLKHGMSSDELYSFFENRLIPDWFNPNAPQIKTGHINPNKLSKEEAMNLLFIEPILIKRPLMIINKQKLCGFDQKEVEKLLYISFDTSVSNSCSPHHEKCSTVKSSAS
jgi:nitrogenase-associated protein